MSSYIIAHNAIALKDIFQPRCPAVDPSGSNLGFTTILSSAFSTICFIVMTISRRILFLSFAGFSDQPPLDLQGGPYLSATAPSRIQVSTH